MKIRMRDGLPFVKVTLIHQENVLEIEDVLLDTGSACTIFSYTLLESAGFELNPDDRIRQIQGEGGLSPISSISYFLHLVSPTIRNTIFSKNGIS